MPRTFTCLWFDTDVEAVARFYTAIFPNSSVLDVSTYPEGSGAKTGQSLVANFELDGVTYMALNGGPDFSQTEAASIVIPCTGQAEIDRYWNALIADGGQESQCGWLKDKFGVSWQVVPENMDELLSGDADTAPRKFAAMMQMSKIVIADLESA